MEHCLDQVRGSCLLGDARCARIVADVLRRFDAQRYLLHAFVVMPNHVHALFSLASGPTLQMTLQGWKGVSSRELNASRGMRGTLWQSDYFDTVIRDEAHLEVRRVYPPESDKGASGDR